LEVSQRSYSREIFEDRVWFFGISDQSPPLFELLLEICEKIKSWLDKSEKNVIVIHCKEGIVSVEVSFYILNCNNALLS